MELGSIGPVEIMFMIIGISQMVFYFTTEPAIKHEDGTGTIVVPANPKITGRAKVGVVLCVAAPLLILREALYAGALPPATIVVIESVARVIGNLLAIPGGVGLLKDVFEQRQS